MAAALTLSTVPVVASVTIDGRAYEVRPFSVGRSLGLRKVLEVLQQHTDPSEAAPEDAEKWLDAATAFLAACVPGMPREAIDALDGESFAKLFEFVSTQISEHDKGRREELASPLSVEPSA